MMWDAAQIEAVADETAARWWPGVEARKGLAGAIRALLKDTP